MDFNLADMFESVVDVAGDREALVVHGWSGGDAGQRLTYAELDQLANRVAHHLASAGIGPGDHVGIQLLNSVEWIATMIGCFKIRAVPVNVNYRYVADELSYLYTDADLVALVYGSEFTPVVTEVAPRVPTLTHLITVGEGNAVPGAVAWSEAVASASPERGFPSRSADDLYIIYTGGTTGMPKGVMWRQEDLFFAGMGGANPTGEPVSAPEEVAEQARTRGRIVMFPVAPLMHGAAQLASWIAFLQASTVVLIRRFDADEVIRIAAREKANSISLVGDAMARPIAEALTSGELAGTPLPDLFAISSAGAILSQAVKDMLQAALPNVMLLDNFGASETGFQGTGRPGSSPDTGLKFQVNERTAVLGDDLKPVRPGSGEVGRVAQRRHVPLGYYKDEAKTKESFVTIDGERWVLLGDMATVEPDGTIAVLGRGAVCINTGGEKVYPEEVEAVLKAHPAVYDAVVAGVPDDRFGSRVAAVVQLRDNMPAPSTEELVEHARGRVAGYKVPKLIVVVPQIQRSPSGKADYPWATATVREAARARSART